MRICRPSNVLGDGLPAPRPDLRRWEERPLWRPPGFGPWEDLGPGPLVCPKEAEGSASEGKMKILEKLDGGVSNTNVGRLFWYGRVNSTRDGEKQEGCLGRHGECFARLLQESREVDPPEDGDVVNFLSGGADHRRRPLDYKGLCTQAKRICMASGGNQWSEQFRYVSCEQGMV